MTTQTKAVQNAGVTKVVNKAMSKSLETALNRFNVRVFLDWSDNEADEIFYVELTSNITNKRVTFAKSFFEASRNSNKVLDRLNQIGNADPSTHSALIYHIHDLIDAGEFITGGYSASSTLPLEWDKQVAMKNARLVARNYLRYESRFALQSSKNYDSSKHFGVFLDKETDLPEGVIAVGFKGSALQRVLNPLGRIQSQKYRREILGGLAHIGVLDAEIAEYDDEEDEESVEVEEKIFDKDGFVYESGKCRKAKEGEEDEYNKQKKRRKSTRLDKQRVVSNNENGVKLYILHFDKSLLEEVAQYVAA